MARRATRRISTAAGEFGILASPDGAPPYERLRRSAERCDLGAFAVLVASIDELIAMRRAANREKDRADVAELQAIARLRARGVG